MVHNCLKFLTWIHLHNYKHNIRKEHKLEKEIK